MIHETAASVDPQTDSSSPYVHHFEYQQYFPHDTLPDELPHGKKSVRRLLILRSLGGICGSARFYCEYPVSYLASRSRASSPLNPCLTPNIASDSLQYLPLADATGLNILAPLEASLVTTRKFTLIEIGSIAICFLGVGHITKPGFVIDLLWYNDVDNYQKNWTSQSWLGWACLMIGVLGGTHFSALTFQFPRSDHDNIHL
ncbi:uncharacterized protein EAF01_003780 [Botrytis porri]|uniref:uncharacterized protein n=1 Tax=Botrytis porri TaxID=87229 RepID=UPI0019019590|nr:uncharacterized protein EAF01_003780 [Botrytis porri]KAF7908025.1 hypothetical protein EAF01_003780 [Botrytis porri]